MFEHLKQRVLGILSFDEMARRSEEGIERALNSKEKDVWLRQLDANLEWFEAWRDEYYKILHRIDGCKPRAKQIIAIRRETLSLIESIISTKPFLFDSFDKSESQLLANAIHNGLSYKEVIDASSEIYVFSQASIFCLRLISLDLGDARENDWFTMYCDIYEVFVENLYRDLIARAKGDIYPLAPLVPRAKQTAEEAKKKVLQGFNWDYDKEAMERDRRQEEARGQEGEPPLQRTVTKHQIEELTEFLVERVGRAKNGKLYKVDDYVPTDLFNIITVDTGLMLIAMSECLENRETAISATRDIIWDTTKRIAPNAVAGKSRDDVSLDVQKELLSMWENQSKDGPLAAICIAATYLLFGIEDRKDDKEHSRAVGALGVRLIDDVWKVIVTTKNTFGWNLSTKPLFSETPHRNDASASR